MRKKRRYSLSPEGVEKLMKRLDEVAQEALESHEEISEGLLEAEITTSFVKALTKVKGIEDVIERNDQLTKTYQGLINMYGFDTMYDMYIYAMSCDLVPEELVKAKDYSKLTPVKRRVVRNGKETEVTVWVNPNKDEDYKNENKEQDPIVRGRQVRRRKRNARDFKGTIAGASKDLNPKEVAQLKISTENMSSGNKPFQDGLKYYLEIKDEQGQIVGVVGYSEEGEYLTMEFFRSNGEVSGVAARGFFELLKLAVEKNKGVKMEDIPEARPLFIKSGLEQKESYWVIESKELQSLFDMRGMQSE